jgi:diguanylate cyclase (GGDEF)-like protein
MFASNNDIQAKLSVLRDAYAEQLPAKIEEIESYRQKCISGNNDAGEAIIVLHRLLHSLAGSGATFGFPELGQQARNIEQMLKMWMNNEVEPDDEELDNLSALLNQLSELAVSPQTEESTSAAVPGASLRTIDEARSLIYILEDDVEMAENLAIQLKHFGYQVKTYVNSKELLGALDRKLPVAVISDIMLPEGELAGIEAMRKYRKEHPTNLPVIFMSTCDDFKIRLEAVRAGGEAYFTKPVNVDRLIDRLDGLASHDSPEPYRILIVDDDPTLAAYYEIVLRQAGMDASVTTQPEKIFELMASCDPELILMDVYMPDCSGMDLVKLIRQQDAYVSVPIVYLSAEGDYAKQLTAMSMGGDDFLTKPIEDKNLVSSVAIRVRRARQLSDLMSQDSLTGLLKHTKIKAQLANELSRAARQNSKMVFAMIDIDHFKRVNDAYGHMAGDRVIKSLARLLQQRFRKSDSIGRYGGEEFAVVMPESNTQDATNIINEIRESFSNIQFFHEGKEFTVTLSAGLSGYPMHDDAEKINQAADEALYKAKENGRNCVVIDNKDE